jgi:tetratricopeptide (TPR) repeat protein
VLALLIPTLVVLLGSGDHRTLRAELRGSAVRDAQLGAILWSDLKEPGAVAAEETGALAALSSRTAYPLRRDGTLPSDMPRYVVLSGGEIPSTDREQALFDSATFLASYAPCELRRGRANEIRDAVWVRRAPPASSATPAYARALRAAWTAQRAGDDSTTLARFAEAAALEPPGLGLAHEGLGIALERRREEPAAQRALEEARSRDPACVLARGHLADRALSLGEIPRADSLVTEAFRFQRELPELRGTRARLFALAGYAKQAEMESASALRAGPLDGRILVNHGILLWHRGAAAEAREMWRRAVRVDPRQIRYLGKFEAAPDSAPAPPLMPLFSDVGFLAKGSPAPADVNGGRSSSAPPPASRP